MLLHTYIVIVYGNKILLFSEENTVKLITYSNNKTFERVVFLIENAFLGNQLNHDNFQKSIQERVDYCKWRMQQLKLDPHDGLAQNMAIFSLLTDTLNIKQPGSEKTITHYPLKYNLNDYDSQKDFTSHFKALRMKMPKNNSSLAIMG